MAGKEAEMLDDSQVQKYLDRIDFDGSIALNRATLDELVLRHQCSVPFETVTLHRRGSAPSLDENDVFEKVVRRRLGGYCFELNKAFQMLLEGLGFKVRPVLCRAVRGRDGRMPINHRGMVAHLDEGIFSVDVGFGGPMPAGALLLKENEEQLIREESYWALRNDDAWWRIERTTRAALDSYDDAVPSRRQTELELCTAAVEEQDFDALNKFFAGPGTLFHDHEVVNLRTENGYRGLKDNVLTLREGADKQIVKLDSLEDVNAALAEHFGMEGI